MKKRKIKWKNIITFVFIIICISLIIYSSIKIVDWFISNKKNHEVKEQINEFIKINEIDVDTNVEEEKQKYEIDWNQLKQKNPDTVAYLKVNNTNIDYIVVKGENNSYYLDHNFNKEYNMSGWVFTDYRNKIDGNDKNLVVFAHDTKDGSMFGSLKNILKESWYTNPENQIIDFVTEEGLLKYQVFSVYKINNEDYYINVIFLENEFSDFIDTIKSRSIYNFNIDVSADDNVLTLSTCSDGGFKRIVLHAKLIE